jgi:hypothetical protein
VPFLKLVDLCKQFPELCGGPRLGPGNVTVDVTGLPHVAIDKIQRNCLMKYPCPGCEGVANCPPFYHMYFYGMDPELWQLGLVNAKGLPVDAEVVPLRDGLVVSFRPPKKDFVEGSIADYSLLMYMSKETGRKGRYSFRAALKVSDGPEIPEMKEMKEQEELPEGVR